VYYMETKESQDIALRLRFEEDSGLLTLNSTENGGMFIWT